MYRRLDPDRIVDTVRALRQRVEERFPGSGLGRVANEVTQVAEEAAATARWLARPILAIRIAVVACVVIMVGAVVTAVVQLEVSFTPSNVYELFEGLEALVNDAVFVAVAIFFLASWETRIKRRRALAMFHQLRSLAHVIDMHQLTKDPERMVGGGRDTPSSPQRTMSAFELIRYLDYCSELLAILAKVAALHVAGFNDPVTLAAVTEIEELSSDLSRKIWQKIVILDRVVVVGTATAAPS